MDSNVIVDFKKLSDLREWSVVDDGVMGGKSAGNFTLNEEGYADFSGSISLDNNGGFSSVRYRSQKITVADYTNVVLNLRGDGKNYQFRVKSNSRDAHSYIAPFSTSGEWQKIEIQLKDMYPSFRGRRLDQPNFSHDYIEEMTFLTGNKKAEDFKLLIESIALK